MTREPRSGAILLVIGAVYVLVIASGDAPLFGAVRIGLLALVLALAVRLRTVAAGWTRVAAGGGAVALVSGLVAVRAGSPDLAIALTSLAVLVMVTAAGAFIAGYLWRRPVADRQTVGGALAVYLLLGLFFASLHQALAAIGGQPYLAGVPGPADGAAYLYFSAVTLTTVGYGDLAPACAAARAVAITEALTGQLYLVAIVGAVVGNWAGQARSRPGG